MYRSYEGLSSNVNNPLGIHSISQIISHADTLICKSEHVFTQILLQSLELPPLWFVFETSIAKEILEMRLRCDGDERGGACPGEVSRARLARDSSPG